MKLIDLLVQELPKLGGWPGQAYLCRTYSHIPDACFWDDEAVTVTFKSLSNCALGDDSVTRQQYEAALAASNQIAWDGAGMPPVGMKVEWLSEIYGWIGGTVAGHDEKYPQVAIIRHDGGYAVCNRHEIRTEAERKREDTKNAIAEFCRASASNGHSADLIYDAIAAGKIPGVKLEG